VRRLLPVGAVATKVKVIGEFKKRLLARFQLER